MPKREGAWTVCRFREEGLAKKRGGAFDGGGVCVCVCVGGGGGGFDTSIHTMQPPRLFYKKGVLKIFTKFTRKHLQLY